jgi:hypothetical protein
MRSQKKVRHAKHMSIHSFSTHLLAPAAPLLAILPTASARTAHALFAAAVAACSITPTCTSITTLLSLRHRCDLLLCSFFHCP